MSDPRFNIPGYINPFDRKKGVKALAWLHSRYLGAHELNVSQDIQRDAIARIGMAALGEGAVISGGVAIKGAVADGKVTFVLSSAEIFLLGSVHDIEAATVTLPATGRRTIGVRLASITLDHNTDATLKGMAPGTRAQGEPMAHAFIQIGVWGWDGDEQEGDFFPIHTIVDGDLLKEATGPQNDALANLLRQYDREVHGHYIVEGFSVTPLGLLDGKQTFSIAEGTVNVYGYKITRPTSARLQRAEEPDIEEILNEPHTLTGTAPFRLDLRYGPLLVEAGHAPATIIVSRQRSVTMTHGAYSGIADNLPDATVFSVMSVKQGGTTYKAGQDYLLNGSALDWSPSGAEPAPGSTYQVIYQYTDTVPPDAVDSRSVTINDGVPGSVALVTYRYKMPRFDAITVDRDGLIEYVKGVSSRLSPQPAYVGGPRMRLADVWNIWGDKPQVRSTGVKRISVEQERTMETRLANAEIQIAELRLKNDISSREPVSKRGIFADPLIDDTYRDQGSEQTAAVFDGGMMLPITASTSYLPVAERMLPYEDDIIIEQTAITGSMKINPYQAFPAPVPSVELSPAVDQWTEIDTVWTSGITRRFVQIISYYWDTTLGSGMQGHNDIYSTSVQSSVESASSTAAAEHIRQRDVAFTLSNFGPGEQLVEILFDGVSIKP